ncbi:MAG: phospho-sugar mutase [Parachlamydiaceae bacterium]|nr:phospho-sugar mutase [Parachlamydiaceae bacterium]
MFDITTKANIDQWLSGPYDQATQQWINQTLQKDPKQLIDSFYTSLSFGTGGLRALTGIGPNRLNKYTVMIATQGLANYIKKHASISNEPKAVFIGYDCRLDSKLFAQIVAQVFAANGIKSYLCNDIEPTPLISFGCRWKKCMAAVMITASHNPPEYNGYKIYWSDGAQIVFPHDQGIFEEMQLCQQIEQVTIASMDHPGIVKIGNELHQEYLKTHYSYSFYPQDNNQQGKTLKVVYSSLHGTGIRIIPKFLNTWGFTSVETVKEQENPDPYFSSVLSPNPENPEALVLGIKQMVDTKADLLLATDPDSDRLGIAIRHQKKIEILNGNQIAVLCLHHICEAYQKQNNWPERAAFIKTIPTTELFAVIAKSYQKPCLNVLTGFKYIAEKIREWEDNPKDGYQYIFGGEESFGYLLGTQVRDKDAVSSAALICEMALQAKLKGKTLLDELNDLYRRYGVYQEALKTISFPDSKEGKQGIDLKMERLRTEGLTHLKGIPVVFIDDYITSTRKDCLTDESEFLKMPPTNMLVITLEDGSKLIIRPSGTEAKIKIYGSSFIKVSKEISDEELERAKVEAKEKVECLLEEISHFLCAS